MTVAAIPSTITYTENGVTTSFAAPFRYNDPSDLVVLRIAADDTVTTLAYGVDFAATSGDTDAGGEVTPTIVSSNSKLLIKRKTQRSQSAVYTTGDRFPAATTEDAFDLAMLIAQEIADQVDDTASRALMVPLGDASVALPSATSRASKFLYFDVNGTPTVAAISSLVSGAIVDALGEDPSAAPSQRAVNDLTAHVDFGNVTSFDTARTTLTGAAYTSSPNWPVIIEGGVGPAVTDRHWHYPRINMNLGGSGASWGAFAVSALAGGDELDTVPELVTAYIIYDTVSPNCTNPNMVPIQGRTVVTTDGRVAGGAFMTAFGAGFYSSGSPTGHHFNLGGVESDVGSNFAATSAGRAATRDAALGGRAAFTAGSMSIQKGDVNSDSGYCVAGLPQMMGGYQQNYPGLAGFRVGFLLTNAFAPTGFGEPVSSDGNIMATAGSWTVDKGINFETLIASTSYFSTPDTVVATGQTIMTAVNHGLILGSVTAANTPHVDFRSSAANTAYDARIIASGGNATIGSGKLSIQASAGLVSTGSFMPAVDNSSTIGSASARWSTGYFGSAPIVGSDVRIKTDIADPEQGKWLSFFRKLRPRTYRLLNIDNAATTVTRTVRRPKMKTIEVDEYVETTVDGARVLQKQTVSKSVPVTETVAVFDDAGKPETERRCIDTVDRTMVTPKVEAVLDADGNPLYGSSGKPLTKPVLDDDGNPVVVTETIKVAVMGDVPRTQEMAVWEDVEETVEITPAHTLEYARLHLGFIAQEVRQALTDAGLDAANDDPTHSVWALFVYDASATAPDGTAGLFLLRYEEFIPLLTLAVQDLETRVSALEVTK